MNPDITVIFVEEQPTYQRYRIRYKDVYYLMNYCTKEGSQHNLVIYGHECYAHNLSDKEILEIINHIETLFNLGLLFPNHKNNKIKFKRIKAHYLTRRYRELTGKNCIEKFKKE